MPEKYVDLHMHSTASDGSCSPARIIELAKEKNLVAAALTDHDTVSGIPEFLEKASEPGAPDAVPGVEISVNLYNREVHIVGLFIDHKNEKLLKLLNEIRNDRNDRNRKIVTRLQSMGYEIALDEIESFAGGESIGRPHFAGVLIGKGYFETPQEVFDKCLKRGTPAYCSRKLPSPAEAIDTIHDAGGMTFWAHAVYRMKSERTYVKKNIRALIAKGLDGIEVYYSTFTPKQEKMMLEFAEEYSLLKSGGSDFHGENQPTVAMGTGINGTLRVPEKIYTDLKKLNIERKFAHQKK